MNLNREPTEPDGQQETLVLQKSLKPQNVHSFISGFLDIKQHPKVHIRVIDFRKILP